MSYKLMYRHGGRPRWYNIGKVTRVSAAEARGKAKDLNAKMVLDDAFDAAWEEGRHMSMEEAVNLALSEVTRDE